jgi:D-galactarolactone cycloisomerase
MRKSGNPMKISAIHPHVLRTCLDKPFAFSQGWVTERAAFVVEVVTDTGLVGWGEALCVGLQPRDISAAAIRSVLAPMLIGCDPREPKLLWHRMYNRTRDYGRKGAVVSGISGIDIALWDLCGKARGEPVFEYDCSDHPFRSAFVDHPVRHVDGWIEIDDRPGLSVEVDREALYRFAAD